jgi:hypothetical protein
MSNGRNIITQHLGAFCGGAFGSGAIFFKPIFLDAVGTPNVGFWQIVGFYAIKLFIFSITTFLGGWLTAWGKDWQLVIKERMKSKKTPKAPPGQVKDDKAA